MTQEEIIASFHALRTDLKKLELDDSHPLVIQSINSNSWFTLDTIKAAFAGIIHMLDKGKLEKWIGSYTFTNDPKTIGVVMAGNIPMVGFHDFLCVLASGNSILIKLSSKDQILIPFLAERLISLNSNYSDRIEFSDRIAGFDAIIATGSDNSARYFEQYFKKFPNVIRKNRISCAIITKEDSDDDLKNIGNDLFSYFGLGCRNVSKLFVPENFNLSRIMDNLSGFASVAQHHKYVNNYDYNKSIYLVNKEPHLDNGFFMLRESKEMVSPISVAYYERYQNKGNLIERLTEEKDKIQCLVSADLSFPKSITPGMAQMPDLWDYADNVDTMKFLNDLTQ